MSFRLISVLSNCEGVILTRLGENQILKSKFQNLIPFIDFISTQQLIFNSNLPRFSKKISFQANLAEKSISFVFETIYGFCSSLRMDSNSTFQISKIHKNFSIYTILAQEVIGRTLSLWPEKPKFSKCSVSNQILGEGYL